MSGSSTPLTRATAFLTADYKPPLFWYEPFELARRTILTVRHIGFDSSALKTKFLCLVCLSLFLSLSPPGTAPPQLCPSCPAFETVRVHPLAQGWVLLQSEGSSFTRLLVALLTSMLSLVLLLVTRPYRRPEDDLLAISAQVKPSRAVK